MSDDTVSRQAALNEFKDDALPWDTFDGYIAPHYVRKILEQLPSAQTEYTENEEKVLVLMFTVVKNMLDLQDGYIDIDCTTFGYDELFDLSQKLGIDY